MMQLLVYYSKSFCINDFCHIIIMLHQNNLHFLRFLLAVFVVLGHAYALTDPDGVMNYSGSLLFSSFTALAVNGFFVISGYLIYNSLINAKHWQQYVANRLLRIVPLFIIVIISSTILCSFFYDGSQSAYWTQTSTWNYLFRNVTIFGLTHFIDGVFTHNPEPHINGSLWSIPYELICYFLFLPIFFLNKKWSKELLNKFFLVGYAFCFFLFISIHVIELKSVSATLGTLSKCIMLFFTGMMIARFNIVQELKGWMIGLCMPLFIFLYYGRYFLPMEQMFSLGIFPFALLILYFSFYPNKWLPQFAKWGDASYGIYLMAFPVQQMIIAVFPNFHPLANFLITILIVIPLAYWSWHKIEKPILSKKKSFKMSKQ